MVFRKRKEAGDRFGMPWDEETVAWFAQATSFDIEITGITKNNEFWSTETRLREQQGTG